MKNKQFHAIKYLLLIYLLGTVVYPLIPLLGTITAQDMEKVLTSAQFLPMLGNSLLTTTMATVISVTLAFALAYALNRSNIRFKSGFVMLFTMPHADPQHLSWHGSCASAGG